MYLETKAFNFTGSGGSACIMSDVCAIMHARCANVPGQNWARSSSIHELVIPRKNPCSLAFERERAFAAVGQASSGRLMSFLLMSSRSAINSPDVKEKVISANQER